MANSQSVFDDATRHSHSNNQYSAGKIDELRWEAEVAVWRAVSCTHHACVEDGQLVVAGGHACEMQARLARFNVVRDGFCRSLAAYFFIRDFGGSDNGS
ncbi:hypothetical protein [Novipirellula artificiosorum]|uniref:Uncharacterized protein n=1 Tax=Novipirellula artificiosorum TaxID=2528016 RepID=A0A5C6DA61_9BACT|nr:hypothetical protein [Novipirellula artificiosorum]TWU31729.1 hypothetical protein Poly41_59640 [Novipirellula artificiosorum]